MLVFVWLTVKSATPSALTHRLDVQITGQPASV
jgi:hypothetical protein